MEYKADLTDKEVLCVVAQCLTFTYSKSLPQTVNNIFGLRIVGNTKVSNEKLELKMSVWGQTGLTVMRHRGVLSDWRQKTPLESFTLRGEVPILLSSPSRFDTLSASALLLATDQYVLFSSFLVSLSPSPWGNVKKWHSSMKQLRPPHQLPDTATERLFLCELILPMRSGDRGLINQ